MSLITSFKTSEAVCPKCEKPVRSGHDAILVLQVRIVVAKDETDGYGKGDLLIYSDEEHAQFLGHATCKVKEVSTDGVG